MLNHFYIINLFNYKMKFNLLLKMLNTTGTDNQILYIKFP